MPPTPRLRLVLVLGFLFLLAGALPAQAVLRVKHDASGAGNGSSWTNAYTTIGAALAGLGSETEIWVAAGTYQESLTLPGNVALYGGFDGTETVRGDRNPEAHKTVIDANGAYHAVVLDTVDTVTLDGFSITGGNANGSDTNASGGGIHASDTGTGVVIENCRIHNNHAYFQGGGIYLNNSSPTLTNCTIFENGANNHGGGVYCDGASPELTNCMLYRNGANYGAGVYLSASSAPTLTNCVFSWNVSTYDGAGMMSDDSSAMLTHCLFSWNVAQSGAGMRLYGSSPEITNCVFFKNDASITGSAMYLLECPSAEIYNTIISSNTGTAVYEMNTTTDPTFYRCIFHHNFDGHYSEDGGEPYRDVSLMNAGIDGVIACVEGDPRFVMDGADAITGTWDEEPAYLGLESTTTLISYGAFEGLDLAGKQVLPVKGDERPALILSNTSDFLTLAGDIAWAHSGNAFLLVDHHIRAGSAAIDAAYGPEAPELDFEGDARFNDPGTPNTGSGMPNYADIGLDEFNTPHVVTSETTDIKARSATISGQVTGEGLSSVTAAGLCWSAANPPTTADNPSTLGSGLCDFSKSISGLTPNTTYYVRAWATNSQGTFYGEVDSFDTHYLGFVDQGASGGDGSTWGSAYSSIQDAVDLMSEPAEIWVAAGTYQGTLAFDYNSYVDNDVEVYGGFTGTETSLDQRDPEGNETILDADGADHAVVLDGVHNVLLDGVTITGGNANGGSVDNDGGGVWAQDIDSSVALVNCKIQGNQASDYGGGMYLESASPIVTGCLITGNSAEQGAGMYVYRAESSPAVTNCVFSGNEALYLGGGITASSASLSLTNCVLSGNDAGNNGGGMQVSRCSPVLTNCVFDGNNAGGDGGGGVYVFSASDTASEPTFTNVIFSANTQRAISEYYQSSRTILRNCLFHDNPQGHYYDAGTDTLYTEVSTLESSLGDVSNCLEGDPRFVSEDDFHIRAGSPAIDAGYGSAAPAEDFEGDPRYDSRGTPNTGLGDPPYADIGVDEFFRGGSGGALNAVYFLLRQD